LEQKTGIRKWTGGITLLPRLIDNQAYDQTFAFTLQLILL
jgi:hypothetical protein